MLFTNKLVITSHMTSNIQWECFISAYYSNATLKYNHDIGSSSSCLFFQELKDIKNILPILSRQTKINQNKTSHQDDLKPGAEVTSKF